MVGARPCAVFEMDNDFSVSLFFGDAMLSDPSTNAPVFALGRYPSIGHCQRLRPRPGGIHRPHPAIEQYEVRPGSITTSSAIGVLSAAAHCDTQIEQKKIER